VSKSNRQNRRLLFGNPEQMMPWSFYDPLGLIKHVGEDAVSASAENSDNMFSVSTNTDLKNIVLHKQPDHPDSSSGMYQYDPNRLRKLRCDGVPVAP
jgi:hypothetical protein